MGRLSHAPPSPQAGLGRETITAHYDHRKREPILRRTRIIIIAAKAFPSPERAALAGAWASARA
jgi:hypothetical protein